MSRTIPPVGRSTRIEADSRAPELKIEELPVAVMWQIEYVDGVRSRGVSLVHSQSALIGLYRLLQQEHLTFKALTSLKIMRCDDLSVEPCMVRVCDAFDHNRRDRPQDNFCYECGKPTRLVRIVEDE